MSTGNITIFLGGKGGVKGGEDRISTPPSQKWEVGFWLLMGILLLIKVA